MSNDLNLTQIENALPNFSIQEEIEAGNIKRVFKANYQGDTVALKIIPRSNSRLEGYTEREIEIMKTINSDVFVDLRSTSSAEIDGQPIFVIVEEFIEGTTLREVIDSGEECLELGIDVTDSIFQVLPEFEEHEIVHRDIKPENLMKSDNGQIQLLDAGVARMNEKETLTPDFQPSGPGTTAYSAPEVLQNERDNQNTRTDLFSTGIVLFESITGEHPFENQNKNIRASILAGERKSLADYINGKLGDDLDKFYKRLTENQPVNRFRKVQHAQDSLQKIIKKHSL